MRVRLAERFPQRFPHDSHPCGTGDLRHRMSRARRRWEEDEAPMAMVTQAQRQYEVTSALGKDVLLFNRMIAIETLSRLFEIDLRLFSPNPAIDAKKLLGTPIGVRIELPSGGNRYLNGLCTNFSYAGAFGELHGYRAVLRPWFWVLTRSADCRIFQKMSTPEIIKQIVGEHGFSAEFKESLTRSYQPWEYCVQYRETAFNFISRLMEHEGIYYYFEHSASKHTMVLVDASSAHSPNGGYDEVPYYPPEQTGRRKRDGISDWSVSWEIQSGKVTHTDYEFKTPSLDLRAQTQGPAGHGHDQEEIYDYPGLYYTNDLGGSLIKIRLDELRARYQVADGYGDARGLMTGSVFKLTGFPRSDQNAEYLITSTILQASSNDYSAAGAGGGDDFSCRFTAISSKEQFRPARVTPKPVVNGPQTALVVGAGGEEIHTDAHGRIMVQFPWDRLGKKNENSSCWIRVGQLWAAGGWGSMWIPRIGMEVIVEFLEGDPDRPIVTGCVYNGTNKPPYGLPGEKTKSTIKSNSSKGGGGYNEMRFEDKKGSEEIWVHAQKDRNLVIEHDETKTVHHDRTKTVDHDQMITIGHDETSLIGNNRTETVGNNETIKIGANRTELVVLNETITIGANRTEQVALNETITIGANRTETVASDETITIGGARTEQVASDETITINGGRTESVAKDESVTISGARTLSIGKDDSQSVGKTLSITAGTEISITCGSASIDMKSNGDITINGKTITITGSGNVVIKGQKILQN
jgi:type VI secretion system secreted protein VgrG